MVDKGSIVYTKTKRTMNNLVSTGRLVCRSILKTVFESAPIRPLFCLLALLLGEVPALHPQDTPSPDLPKPTLY